MPSWEIFEKQDEEYKRSVLPEVEARVSVEAGVTMGWERYVGSQGGERGHGSLRRLCARRNRARRARHQPRENVANTTLGFLERAEQVEETPAVEPTPPEEGHS